MSTVEHRTSPNISYFVTTKCPQSRSIFQIPENAKILIDTVYRHRDKSAYLLHEFVIMSDHIHLILTPNPTISLEKAMQLIKGGSSFEIHKQRQQKMEIWQQGFHDWTIRDASDWQTRAEYIAMNPAHAHLVESFRDWPYSSASGKFVLDPMPRRFSNLSSGAKAQDAPPPTRGLKPPPPKEAR